MAHGFFKCLLHSIHQHSGLCRPLLRHLEDTLGGNYVRASESITKKGISFSPANTGPFLWLDLSECLVYFEGTDELGYPMSPATFSRDVKFCRWMLSRGLFISQGEERMLISPPYSFCTENSL